MGDNEYCENYLTLHGQVAHAAVVFNINDLIDFREQFLIRARCNLLKHVTNDCFDYVSCQCAMKNSHL